MSKKQSSDSLGWTEEEEEDVLMASEDDFFSESVSKGTTSVTTSQTSSEVLCKYKTDAVSFCHADNLLFSLHVKEALGVSTSEASSFVAFVEVTDLRNGHCLHPCLVKSELRSKSEPEDLWLEAVTSEHVKSEVKRKRLLGAF